VTAQLNEFINYSRPREVNRTTVPLRALIQEVSRALSCDLEEKQATIKIFEDTLSIEADEPLLRQSLFNLLLNAIQAISAGGTIEVKVTYPASGEATLQVLDDGCGVPANQLQEIFKPYFTTHQKGTGLGLAVVQKIVLAHGWDIECLPREPKGTVFQISHLKVVSKS
jgi:two-component system sensor histidine kinase HydH